MNGNQVGSPFDGLPFQRSSSLLSDYANGMGRECSAASALASRLLHQGHWHMCGAMQATAPPLVHAHSYICRKNTHRPLCGGLAV